MQLTLRNARNLSFLVLAWAAYACDISENEILPGESFTKIYNSEDFEVDYDPLYVVQTQDSAYLILAAKDAWTPYLLRADNDGNFLWDLQLEQPYVNPTEQLFSVSGDVYMVCMNELNLSTYILKINLNGQLPEVVYNNPELLYPLSASVESDGSWVLQNFDSESRKTKVTKISASFDFIWQQELDIMEDVEEPVIKHLTRTGKRMPFFNGYSQNTGNGGFYYVNGFHNFTMSLSFLNPSDGEILGVINGFRDSEYLNAAEPLPNANFALAKNSYDDNFLLPQAILSPQSISSSSDLESNRFPEIDPTAKIRIRGINTMNRQISLYATNTKSRRIVLYAYDAEDGTLLSLKYLGQTSPYEIGNFVKTLDGGLIVLGNTFVAGRFSRLCLFKLTKSELEDFVL